MSKGDSPLIRFREDPEIVAILEEEVANEGGSVSAFMRKITRKALRDRGCDVPPALISQGRRRKQTT